MCGLWWNGRKEGEEVFKNLNFVVGEEAEALKVERGEAGEEEDALVEEEGAHRRELELAEIGDQTLQQHASI